MKDIDMVCEWESLLSPCAGQLHWSDSLDCCYCDRHEDDMRQEEAALYDDLYPEQRHVGKPQPGQ